MACRRKRTCNKNSKSSKNNKANEERNAVKVVLEFLSKVDMAKSSEISEKTGLDKKTVDKVIKKLKEEGKIESPKRCYYSLKK